MAKSSHDFVDECFIFHESIRRGNTTRDTGSVITGTIPQALPVLLTELILCKMADDRDWQPLTGP